MRCRCQADVETGEEHARVCGKPATESWCVSLPGGLNAYVDLCAQHSELTEIQQRELGIDTTVGAYVRDPEGTDPPPPGEA